MASPAAAPTPNRADSGCPRRSSRPCDRQHRDRQHKAPPHLLQTREKAFTTASPTAPPPAPAGDRGVGPGARISISSRARRRSANQRHDAARMASRPMRRIARPRRDSSPSPQAAPPCACKCHAKADLEAAHGFASLAQPARTPRRCEATSMRKFRPRARNPGRGAQSEAAVGGHDHRVRTLLARRARDPDRS